MGVQGIAISTNGSADMSFYEALVRAGVNDFAVSCDTNDMVVGKALAGVKRDDTWLKVITNIRAMSKLAYVNLGITINALNCNDVPEILAFTDDLGVADMKLSTATSWNRIIQRLGEVPQDLLARHPILRYRVNGFLAGRNVRGLREGVDCHRCPLVQDDIILVDGHHYPCLVYAREKGQPIGTLKDVAEMREERRAWQASRDTHTDPICKPMCMDIFMDCNNRITELQGPIKS
jgi:molybdenum cofactor biosynthesis enzyme MoaA